MIERAHDRHALWPERLVADTGYGSAEMLAWLVHERGIEPHIPVFDKSARTDGTFSRGDFRFDASTAKPMPTSARPRKRSSSGRRRIATRALSSTSTG